MPLPPAPAKRAALLSERDYDVPVARLPQTRKTASPLAEPRLTEIPQARVVSEVTQASGQAPAAALADRSASRTRTPRTSPSARKTQAETDVQVQTPLFAPVPAPVPASTRTQPPADIKPKKTKHNGATKLFVLDTNVLLHDPMCLFRFEEHDIFLPMIVLEELDAHKKGTTEVARNARQTSRSLDALAGHQGTDIASGLPLNATGHREASGKLFFQTQLLDYTLPTSLPQGKADNQILGVVEALRQQQARQHKELSASTPDSAARPGAHEVVLVSKDINMRVKARALGLATDDYQNDKTLDDGDLLYSGAIALPANFWTSQAKTVESWQQGAYTFYRISGPMVANLLINQFVYFESPGEPSLYARVTEIRGKTAVFKTLKDYTHLKHAVWGVTSRNREQNFALNILMDPEIDFVTLTGQAGTGKTLMALAAGLTQVLDDRRYTEIIVTRATVSVGEDIGFLPGTEEEKMGPWMGALDDNLEVLGKTDTSAGEWGRAATSELIRSRIKIKSMNFMRGRTFLNKYVIIDEAQNLTPKQMKTLITRAGPGTKIICMGNIAQIDTPYLTEGSSGLTYAVDRFKGWAHGGHITLARGERSRLADFASEVL